MDGIAPLSLERVTALLEARDVHSERTSISGRTAYFAADEECPEFEVHFSIEGDEGEFFNVRATPSLFVSMGDWPGAVGLVNRWNARCREPRAVLQGITETDLAKLWAMTELLVGYGVHDDLVAGFIGRALYSVVECFKWMGTELPKICGDSGISADELENWLLRPGSSAG